MIKVLVLGCGPAGLLAAHTAERYGGAQVDIFSKRVKSILPGAQYLHEPLPGLSTRQPLALLNYIKLGTAEGYASKVYGSPHAPVSWHTYGSGMAPAWSIHEMYDQLWDEWHSRIVNTHVSGQRAHHWAQHYDLVINTIPRPAICRNDHEFKGQTVYFAPIAPKCPVNTIIYSGRAETPWYRMSNIFGHESTEYSENSYIAMTHDVVYEDPHDTLVPIRKGFKPTDHNCDCMPDNMIGVGRFGAWKKDRLVHHVYNEVDLALFNL